MSFEHTFCDKKTHKDINQIYNIELTNVTVLFSTVLITKSGYTDLSAIVCVCDYILINQLHQCCHHIAFNLSDLGMQR